MQVWTVVNQKGGVGKTTSAISLAGSLAQQGAKVLCVDLDPHASLSYYLGAENTHCSALYDVFISETNESSSLIHNTDISNLSVICADESLATLDNELGQTNGKGLIIRQLLSTLVGEYDFAVVDCPPVLGVLMVNGLMAADHIVVPTQTEHLALRGLHKMMHTLDLMRDVLIKKPSVTVVATMFDKRLKACQKAYIDMKNQCTENLWRGYIPTDTKFRQASQVGLPICFYAKTSRGTFAYDKLTKDLMRK